MLVVARIRVGRHNRFYREEARALITIHLSADDLARVRMAPSPLRETVCSFGVLTNPNRHSVHAPWARRARQMLRGADVSPLVAAYRTAAADFASRGAPPYNQPLRSARRAASTRLRTPSFLIEVER
jgi:hypothetical protein